MSGSDSDSPPRCYNRVENEEPAFSSCSTSGEPAHCCDLDTYRCATNGLCVVIERFSSDERYVYNTGGCTDSSWEAGTCVDHCRQFNHSGVNTCGTGAFCCRGPDNCDCDATSERYFTLDPVRLVESSATSSTATSSGSSTIPPASATASSADSSSTTIADTAAADSSTNDDSSDNSLASGLGAGLGVGIPLAALILGLIWFMRRRKRRTNTAATEASPAHVQAPQQHLQSPYGATPTSYNGFSDSSTYKSSSSGWMSGYENHKAGYTAMSERNEMVELGDTARRAEMEGGPSPAVELPAGR